MRSPTLPDKNGEEMAVRLALLAVLWVLPTASLRWPVPSSAAADAVIAKTINATITLDDDGGNATTRRRLRLPNCGEGSIHSQHRKGHGDPSSKAQYYVRGEPRDPCFEPTYYSGGDASNPSPNSFRTRAGKVGDKNQFVMPEVSAKVR